MADDDLNLRETEAQEATVPSEEQAPPAPARTDIEERYQNLQSALAEERYRRAQLQQEMAALRSQAEQFGTLRHELDEYRKTVRQEEEDPVTELKREIKGLSERYHYDQQQSLQERQALAQRLELENQVRSQVSEFMRRKPDYQQAYNFVVNRRQSDYQRMGIPPQLWAQRLENEVSGLLNETRLYGTNAAEALYGLAENWGYRPPAPHAQGDGGAARSFEVEPGPTSLSDMGGQGDVPLSLKNISSMSDEEFEKAWAAYEKAAKRGR
jgi:archaellum component FlaC